MTRSSRHVPFGRRDQAVFDGYLAINGASAIRLGGRSTTPIDLFGSSLWSSRHYWRNCFDARRGDGAKFRVYAGVVADAGPNAFAWIKDDVHLVGLNAGLAMAIFELSCFCLSQADILTEFGVAGREQSPQPTGLPPGFDLPSHLVFRNRRALFDALPTYFPQDPTRQAIAHYLALLTLRFVWFHELYHALNGHVGFVRQQDLALRLNEAPDGADGQHSEILKTLEFDADQSAFFVCCRLQANDSENIIGLRQLSIAQRLKLTLFGAYAITWLFEEQARRQQRADSATHPTPYLRMHNLLRCAAAYLDDDIPQLSALNQEVLTDFDRLSRALHASGRSGQFLKDMQSARFQATLDAYDELNAQLQPHYHAFGYR